MVESTLSRGIGEISQKTRKKPTNRKSGAFCWNPLTKDLTARGERFTGDISLNDSDI